MGCVTGEGHAWGPETFICFSGVAGGGQAAEGGARNVGNALGAVEGGKMH